MRLRATVGLFLASGCVVGAARGAPVYKDDDKKVSLNVGVLVQPSTQVTTKGAPDGSSASVDFYLRRVQLIVQGSLSERLHFFVASNQSNWGRNPNTAAGSTTKAFDATANPIFIQDAFFSFEAAHELIVDGGVMHVPFSHAFVEGAPFLHGLDYRLGATQVPASMGRVLRDAGVQLRGLLFGERVHYRAGVFEGSRGPGLPASAAAGTTYPPLNETGAPRLTGMVRLNLLGSEPDFFFKGIYFSPTPLVSLGVGADYQHHGVRVVGGSNAGAVANYRAQSADLFFEVPFSSALELVGKTFAYHYQEGENATTTGYGYGGEAGLRYDWFEPIATFERFDAAEGAGFRPADAQFVRAGLNVWFDRFATNLKAEVAFEKTHARASTAVAATSANVTTATLQTQIFF